MVEGHAYECSPPGSLSKRLALLPHEIAAAGYELACTPEHRYVSRVFSAGGKAGRR
jgi:hypothetical protein